MLFNIQYTWRILARNKTNLFWILFFPITLGCLFKVAFSNMSTSERFSPVPVAIVCEEGAPSAEPFCAIAEELGKEGENQMLAITWCDEKEAMRLLKEKSVDGILFVKDRVTLTVSSNMNNVQINQSILQILTERYNAGMALLEDTAALYPDRLAAAAETLQTAISGEFCREISYSRSPQDPYTQYFYNLIAMACLFASMAGLHISLNNQGNLTALGARKNISATGKLTSITSELIATALFEFLLNTLAFLFLVFVLKVDMTARLPLAVFSILISSLTGVSLGFFIGSIGNRGEDFKTGVSTAVSMVCCFLSGLMVGNMRILIEEHAPFLNRINPAALISDSFYCLNVYESLERYAADSLTLILLSAGLCLGGFLMTRRKRYAGLSNVS